MGYIKDSHVKVGLAHHPTDWLVIEKDTTAKKISTELDILCVGHIHEAESIMKTGMIGTSFVNVAPSCTSDPRIHSHSFSNGVTIINYNHKLKEIETKSYIYDFESGEYVLNSNIDGNGVFFAKIPCKNIKNIHDVIERGIKKIKEDFYSIIDEQIISQKANAGLTLLDSFVMPPIKSKDSEDTEANLTLLQILKCKQNQLFFGTPESGKTTLLYRLLHEYTDKYNQLGVIPIYFNIEECRAKEINSIIKDFIGCNSEEVKALVSASPVIFLIDNLDYTQLNDHFIRKLKNYLGENDNIRLIATASCELSGITPTYFENNILALEVNYILTLRACQIKEMLTKWTPKNDAVKTEQKLENMVSKFCSYSLPCTPMSVSMFLWSTEKSGREPINHAVLLDIYIELALEKLHKDNIYRTRFDYRNKTMVLARIAEVMLSKDNFCINYSDYLKEIEAYISKVGFDFDATKIAEYFIERKIISKNNNVVKFTHACFFHFFVARRMEDNMDFREQTILNVNEFYKYPREIDFYTGLTRNDEQLMKFIFSEFRKHLEPIAFVLDKINVDKFFTKIKNDENDNFNPIVKSLDLSKVQHNRPEEKDLLVKHDNRLEQIPEEIVRVSDKFSLEKLIVIMCNVLRNSEGVENIELKKEIYNSIIRHTVAWSVWFKELIVRYVMEHKKLPPFMPENSNVDFVLKFIPFCIQNGIQNHIGTYKLTTVMLSKIYSESENKTVSDIEKYFSISLFWDNYGANFDRQIDKFIKRVGNNIVQDYLLVRLLEDFYRKTKSNSNEEEVYLELITQLKLKHDKLPKRLYDQVKKSFVANKKSLSFSNDYFL